MFQRTKPLRWTLLCWLLLTACLDDVEVPPPPPELLAVESPTRRMRQRIEGSKPAGAAVLNHGEILVPHDDAEAWSAELSLQPGDNPVDLTSQWRSGLESVKHTLALIVYEPNFPVAPSLEPVASPTNQSRIDLRGQRPAGTSVLLRRVQGPAGPADDRVIAPASNDTAWSATLNLTDGDGLYHFELRARDARGRDSEPRDLRVELDTQAPVVRTRYPGLDEVDVATNSLVSVGFDGPLGLDDSGLDPALLSLNRQGGGAVGGTLIYNSLSHSLVLDAALEADTNYIVSLDATLRDVAGNAHASAPADWTWSFTTGSGEDGSTPDAPSLVLPAEVDTATGLTHSAEIVLSGSKPAWTSLWINGREYVALNSSPQWSVTYSLEVGDNTLQVLARGRNGFASSPVQASLRYEVLRPDPPVLTPPPPATVSEPVLVLEGTRPTDTSVLLDGVVVAPRGPDTTWVYNADLLPGVNTLLLHSRDASGVLSEPLQVQVDFTQSYEGLVPPGFKLVVSFGLRDLSAVQPIASSFDTGASRYAVDAWVEGPLQAGEQCVFDAASGERQSIDYVATLVHYLGQKQGHTNPFWDADYRAPDYLAALVSGGVFESVGIPANATRRASNGSQGGDLVDTTGRIRVSTQNLADLVDGVTEATTSAGLKVLEWLPLSRDLQRLPQGEYLLHIQISLDRDPGWVAANDTETCWDDASFVNRGQHRIVKRISLGDTPFSTTLGQLTEASAPDTERGADQLRYIDEGGVTLRWLRP